MFCGHFDLNFAPRFSGTGALGSFFRPLGGAWLELGPADVGWDELVADPGCDKPERDPRVVCARVEGNVNSSLILFTAFRWRFAGGAGT